MRADLYELVLERDELAELDPAARRLALRELVKERVAGYELGAAVQRLVDEIDGYGLLGPLMRDATVTDVLVNGPEEVWAERAGALERCDLSFADHAELACLVERLLGRAGARADASMPIADARLPDGARMHVVLPPLAPGGPLVSIRRHLEARPSLDELLDWGTLDVETAQRLHSFVGVSASVVVSGATGTGKTTLLNALVSLTNPAERVVVIEETPELAPTCAHAVSLVARPANLEGAGEVGLDVLLRAALRMRPDRLVVGEVRGSEALTALLAMATGHPGSMLTIHARSAEDALDRFTMLALSARSGASEASLRTAVERAVDVVVHLERTEDGRRVVGAVHEF